MSCSGLSCGSESRRALSSHVSRWCRLAPAPPATRGRLFPGQSPANSWSPQGSQGLAPCAQDRTPQRVLELSTRLAKTLPEAHRAPRGFLTSLPPLPQRLYLQQTLGTPNPPQQGLSLEPELPRQVLSVHLSITCCIRSTRLGAGGWGPFISG